MIIRKKHLHIFLNSSVSMNRHEILEELPKYEDLKPHWCSLPQVSVVPTLGKESFAPTCLEVKKTKYKDRSNIVTNSIKTLKK